jgi:two-component system alkaline phosphatase synthesis response regulator PhoP
MPAKVLIIEDNADLASGLRYNLELEGYEVQNAGDGGTGLEAARTWCPDLIILDLMLPGMDGYQVLQSFRSGDKSTPVLILSARTEESDKVRGFRLDADQYVTKPFGLLELLERVKSLLRRSRANAEPAPQIQFGDALIDPAARTIRVRNEDVVLTPKAFDLMLALIRRNGAVASRVELLREVWGHRHLVMTRTVDSHIAELRRKVESNPAEPRHFLTVWKVGYRFQP